MNSLATLPEKPLRALVMDEARGPLLILFSSYREPWADKGAQRGDELRQAQVSAYLMGLEGLPGWAIEAAVRDFIQGKIDRPARRKGELPTVEELSTEARGHVDREASRQRVERQLIEQFEERKEEFPPENRVRMGFKMSVLSCGIGRREVEKVAAANARGLEDMVGLAQEWGVPVPEGVFKELKL